MLDKDRHNACLYVAERLGEAFVVRPDGEDELLWLATLIRSLGFDAESGVLAMRVVEIVCAFYSGRDKANGRS